MGGFPPFRSNALSGFGAPSAPSLGAPKPTAFKSRALSMLDEPEEPEEESFGSKLLDIGKAAVNIGSAGIGGLIGRQDLLSKTVDRFIPESLKEFIPDTSGAYERAMKANLEGQDKPLSVAEQISLAPGGGRVLAETLAPGTPSTAAGRIAKDVGGLVGDIATDPLTYVTGGIGAAGQALKAGKVGTAAARALGSAPAGLVYAPEILGGIKESGGEALSKLREGDFSGAVEPGVNAALLSGLGALMATGTVKDAGDLMRRFGRATPSVPVPEVRPEPSRLSAALDEQATRPQPASLDDFLAQIRDEPLTLQEAAGAPEIIPDVVPPQPLPFVRPEAPVDAPGAVLDDGDRFVDVPAWTARYPDVLPDRTIGRTRVKSETPENFPIQEPGLLAPDGQRSLPTIHGPLIDDTQPFNRNADLEARHAELMAQNPEAAQAFVEAAEGAREAAERRISRKRGPTVEPEIRPAEDFNPPGSPEGSPGGDPRLQDPNSLLGKVARAEEGLNVGRYVAELDLNQPRYAFRARDVGEAGIPAVSHAQASLSEADVRRVAPSRTESPQEVVRVDLSKLDPQDYEVIPRGEGEAPWVRFKREMPEDVVEPVGPVDRADIAAASKAEPPVVEAVAKADTADLAQVSGLSMKQAEKGAADVIADGMREFSPEAVAIKRAVIAGEDLAPTGTEGRVRESSRAFHGSPHDFDRFELSDKTIGTGEGAQAYGHGLYFAGNRDVAEFYKRKLSSGGDDGPGSAADWVRHHGSRDAALEAARKAYESEQRHFAGSDQLPEVHKIWAKTLGDLEAYKRGKLYEVNLKPDEGDYLLWDKPLSEQSPKVQKALATVPLERIGLETEAVEGSSRESWIKRIGGGRIARVVGRPSTVADLEGVSINNWMSAVKSPATSDTLREAGIPGIKYLDGTTRGVSVWNDVDGITGSKGWKVSYNDAANGMQQRVDPFPTEHAAREFAEKQASYNYVIFDDSQVDVVAKYKNRGAAPRMDPNARWNAGEEAAVPLVGRWNLANPHESLNAVAPRVAKATERLMPSLGRVVEAAARMAGESVNLKGLTLDSNIQAAVKGKDMRVGIMAAVENAKRKFDSREAAGQYDGLSKAQKNLMLDREVARHIVNPVAHEIAHARADRLARTSKQVAEGLDKGGHGPAYVKALQDVYRKMSQGRDMLRRHIEQALDEGGGKLRDSLQQAWAEVEPVWRGLDAGRSGVPVGDGGTVSLGSRSGPSQAPSGPGRLSGRGDGPQSGVRLSTRGGEPSGGLAPGSGVRSGSAIKPIPDKPAPTKGDKVLEAWRAGLVSAPGTLFVANPLGNLAEQIVRVGETATSALVDRFFKGNRTRLKGEARVELAGAAKVAPSAVKTFLSDVVDALKLAPEKGDPDAIDRQPAIGGKTGRAVRIPFRILQAGDDLFKTIGGSAELHKLAWREAGGDKAKFEAIRKNPSEALLSRVAEAKKARTFQDPNRMAQSLVNLRNQHKWLNVVMPFVQTPANIASLALKRSPVGFYEAGQAYQKYRRAISAGADAKTLEALKGEAVDAIARPLLGTMVLGTFAAYAKSGGMTGSGPVDQKEKNLLKETGWQPYSFVIGEKGNQTYIPFNRFEPISSLLGFAADVAEAQNTKSAGDLFDKGMGSIVTNLTSKTYLQGLADAAELINDPKRFAGQYASNLAASAVPNVVKKATQAIDPVQRDTRPSDTGWAGIPERIGKAVAASIPGVSKTLPERRAVTGETVERAGNTLSRFLSPVQVTSDKPARDLEGLMVELGVSQGAPSRTVSIPKTGAKVQLTQAEYKFLQDVDKKATDFLRRQTNDPRFKRLPEDQQRAYIERVFRSAGDEGRKKLLSTSQFKDRARQAVREARA